MMQNNNTTNRRDFIKLTTASLGSAALFSGCSITGEQSKSKSSVISQNNTILLQGDSITDSGRSRGQKQGFGGFGGNPLGNGYVNFVAALLTAKLPSYELNIQNRGISGNKVYDLDNRWDADCLELKPDVLSILIGVNDIWHKLDGRYPEGTIEKYETDYRALLNRTIKAMPNVKLVICEPFVLRCGSVNDKWFPEFDGYRASAQKMSQEFKAVFVPFQTMFDNAIKDTKPEYWAADGVHPTTAGAMLMALEWIKAVGV